MKKRIFSAFLTMVLVVSMALGVEGISYAAFENSSSASETVDLSATMKTTTNIEMSKTKATYTPASLKCTPIISSATPASYSSYALGAGTGGILAITPEYSGRMYLDIKVAGGTYDCAQVALCESYSYSSSTGISYNYYEEYCYYVYGGESGENLGAIPVTAGNTYYIAVAADAYNDADITVSLRAKVMLTQTSRTLSKSSNWAIASGVKRDSDNATTIYWKVKPSTTGAMTVYLKEYGYSTSTGYVTLCDSNKKALSNELYYSSDGNKVYFGVKKGVTYYLKVTKCCGSYSYGYRYGIKYSLSSRIDRDLNSKSEAKNLSRKADATRTLFVASTSTSSNATTDWYKFYVSSKRATRITVNTAGIRSGSVTVTVYKGSTKIGSDTISYASKNPYDITYGTTYGKANSGTYYVKVKKSSKASGTYTIRYDY